MNSIPGKIIDLIVPRACGICGGRLSVAEDVICGRCNLHLPRTYYSSDAYDNEMARLFWKLLPIERAAALFYYESHSPVSNIVYSMKYGGHPEMCETMGEITAAEFSNNGFFAGIDMIVPIPLAAKRLRERGYNQSVMIARGVSRITGLPVADNAVIRTVFKESQTNKDRWMRQENVKGVFMLKDAAAIRGRHILIIDDIVTTGATITSCGGELVKAGDVKISVLSLGFAKG